MARGGVVTPPAKMYFSLSIVVVFKTGSKCCIATRLPFWTLSIMNIGIRSPFWSKFTLPVRPEKKKEIDRVKIDLCQFAPAFARNYKNFSRTYLLGCIEFRVKMSRGKILDKLC